MPVTDDQVSKILKEKLSTTHLEVIDESGGCGAKFSIIVVSSLFSGKPLLDRHRLVNDALKEELKEIHALSMQTWTPEQYEKKKADKS